jgi:methionyl-tRNA formyltransferase
MEVIFLGINDVGMRVYEWLCDRGSVDVLSLLTTKEQLNLVEKLQPDIVVSVGYRHILPEKILSIPERGCINLHPAYLPYNRGANPNVWSIIEDTPAGVTLHYMDDGIDTGDIIARKKVETSFNDTGKSLYQRLEQAQFELFTENWSKIESGDIDPISQEEVGTYHEVQDFEELCELDSDSKYTVKDLLDRLRALTFPPFNNTLVEVDGEKYYIEVNIRHEDHDRNEDPEGYLSSY